MKFNFNLVESYICEGNIQSLTQYLKKNIDYHGLDECQKEKILKFAANAQSIASNNNKQDKKNRTMIFQILNNKFEEIAAAKQSMSLESTPSAEEDYELVEPSETDEAVSDDTNMFSKIISFMFAPNDGTSPDNSNKETQLPNGTKLRLLTW